MNLVEPDVFARDVFCIQGIPIDAVTMPDVVRRIRRSAQTGKRLFLSTPNLNFLVGVQDDPEFRDTVLASDLNIADGMPIIWIAWLLGLPVRHRLAGSNLLSALGNEDEEGSPPIRIVFFGGLEGAGQAACRAVNANSGPVSCAGAIYPGFRTADELSEDPIIYDVNAIEADFLIVALGARKGQIWLHRNEDRLKAPVRSHLGALINMAAGSIRKAPPWVENSGLEWLWRIREEPALWRRYLKDGLALIAMLCTRILPLVVLQQFDRRNASAHPFAYHMDNRSGGAGCALLTGYAMLSDRDAVRALFRELFKAGADVRLDLDGMQGADPGFFGLLMVLARELERAGRSLDFISVSLPMERRFRLNGLDWLLERSNRMPEAPGGGSRAEADD